MFRFLLALLLVSSLAHAEMVTVECSDGPAQFERADLQASKCLRVIQLVDVGSVFDLKGIDSKSLKLFIKLSKLNDDKLFAFIDSLDPDAFQVIDHYAKYLQTYHELDALFKYKYLKEYSPQGDQANINFVDEKYKPFKFVEDPQRGTGKWKFETLFATYLPEFNAMQIPEGPNGDDYRAFFVLIDFYQETWQKPLPIKTDHLKKVFSNIDNAVQSQLITKNLVII